MLTDEKRLRVDRQIKNITAGYKQAKAAGYNIAAIGLPKFESQDDHDKYHPDDAGANFQEHNEFAAEILKGLRANGVPAELVTVRYAEYAEWLRGRKNTGEMRSQYTGHLAADLDQKRASS